jgi:hypothetical protein
VLYERILLRKSSLSPNFFAGLIKEEAVNAVRDTIDENLRYHQFYGSLSLLMPLFTPQIVTQTLKDSFNTEPLRVLSIVAVCLVCLVLEMIIVFAAVTAFCRYVNRSRSIMTGG